MADIDATIVKFLGTDPIAGEVALRDLVALGDAGEEALFADARPYPELRQHQRRWLRYVATREQTILDRLLSILRGDGKNFSRHTAAFLLAGVADTRRASSGVFDLLSAGFDTRGRPSGQMFEDYHPYTDLFEAAGYAGGSASALWHHVSTSSFAWEKLSTFAFRAACFSFARVNASDAWALEQLVLHTWRGHEVATISTDASALVPNGAVDAAELWMQAYRVFGAWRRGEVADEVLRRWSNHEHWRVRAFGAEILAALGFSRIVAPVVNWLRREPVTQVRDKLLAALGGSATQEGADLLLESLEGGQSDSYGAAAREVWRAEDKDRARRALLGLSEDSRSKFADALVSLARLGLPHPRLTASLDSPEQYIRLNAALAHAYLADGSVRPRLAQMQQEAAGPMENIMLAAALAMLGEPGGGAALHQALVAGAAEGYTRGVDLSACHSPLREAVLAGFAAGGDDSRPFLQAWRAELAPLDPVVRPVAPAEAPARSTRSGPPGTLTPAATRSKPLSVFVSYSHRDERMRERLGHHLATLESQGLIRIWQDREIEPAADWEGEINREIQEADIVLLLVSASFIQSRYCQQELTKALTLRAQRKSLAIPIILRPCDWEPVFNLPCYKTQALPRDNRPIAGSTWPNQDTAFSAVARELRQLFERMQKPDLSA